MSRLSNHGGDATAGDVGRSTASTNELEQAVALIKANDLSAAAELCNRMIAAAPDDPEALCLLGIIATYEGRLDAASELLEQAIRQAPTLTRAWNALGSVRRRQGRHDKAADAYRHALEIDPDMAEAWHNLGNALSDVRDYRRAEAAFLRAIDTNSELAAAYKSYGQLLQRLKRHPEALAAFASAIEHAPLDPDCHCGKGQALADMGQCQDALACYRHALDLAPKHTDALNALGNALGDLGRFDDALKVYKELVDVRPTSATAYNNIGLTLKELGRLPEAIESYDLALQQNPELAEAHNNRAVALRLLGRLDEAITSLQQAIACNPQFMLAKFNLMTDLSQVCGWQEAGALGDEIDEATQIYFDSGALLPEPPFSSITRHDDPDLNQKSAKAWAELEFGSVETLPARSVGTRAPERRIRIGYLSNNFRDHATAHLVSGIFGRHDRRDFEVFCFSYGVNDGSKYRKIIASGSDEFVDIYDLDTRQAAGRIRDAGVDILIDMVGWTRQNRLHISAFRPAPIQVSYLGFAGTTGADFFDYNIVDRIAVPIEHMPFWSEKLLFMPDSYLVTYPEEETSESGLDRRRCGLPEDATVFCSFNQSYKITPEIWQIWMGILDAVPNSVLWLLSSNELATDNLHRAAKDSDIAPDRIIFAPRADKPLHMERLRLADLALDTTLVNGHTTTCDALLAGVPVLTVLGRHFSSRVSASALYAAGLGNMVQEDLEKYTSVAIELGRDAMRRNAIRKLLIASRSKAALFDTDRFVANLDAGFRRMFERAAAGKQPDHIWVNV